MSSLLLHQLGLDLDLTSLDILNTTRQTQRVNLKTT